VFCADSEDLNVKIAVWGYVLTLASGCFIPNHSSQTNISQGRTDYTIVSTVFHHVWIFFEYEYILCKKGKEVWI